LGHAQLYWRTASGQGVSNKSTWCNTLLSAAFRDVANKKYLASMFFDAGFSTGVILQFCFSQITASKKRHQIIGGTSFFEMIKI